MTSRSATALALRALKAFDDRRPSLPGEHWVAFAGGVGALRGARRSHSTIGRAALLALGGLLLLRALSGRDGPVARASRRHDGGES